MTISADSVESRLDAMAAQVELLVAEAEERRLFRESLAELTEDLTPIARQGVGSLTRVLDEAEERGYVDFTRGSLGVVDRVVTSFSKEDVEALGDNIVLILETLKEMTQPEVMQMLRSTLIQASEIEEPVEAPSLFSLLVRLRDPAARRGIYRLIFLLESLGTVQTQSRKRKEAQQ